MTVAANDWHERRDPWEARIGGDVVLSCSYDAAADNSRMRREAIASFDGSLRRAVVWLARVSRSITATRGSSRRCARPEAFSGLWGWTKRRKKALQCP